MRVLIVDPRQDFRCPIHRLFAVFLVLREARVAPLLSFYRLFVFFCAGFDRATRFSHVDGVGAARAVEFVDSLALAWRRATFVFGAQNALKRSTPFVIEVASSFFKSSLECVGNSRYVAQRSIWPQFDFLFWVRVKR